MAQTVSPIPEGYRTVNPVLVEQDAPRAIAIHKLALGAEEMFRMSTPDGRRIAHAELPIGDSVVMVSGEFEQWAKRSPKAYGGSPASIGLYVADVDAIYRRAVEAGAETKMPPADMFRGDGTATVVDPSGHEWTIATAKEKLSPAKIAERSKAFFAQAGS